MNEYFFDAAVIGAGAAGMAAAKALSDRGFSCALIDRESSMGGILPQCIHNGFGLHRFGEELTGPEFSARLERDVLSGSARFFPDTTVLSLAPNEGLFTALLSSEEGVSRLTARSVVLAMGSRERNRGNLRIAGDRPAGVFTAGLAQRLMNIEGYLPGRRAVIIGSGDIGLIMARRLTLAGAKVEAVVEIQQYPSGLTRNVVQCLEDFGIPLLVAHATVRIIGRERVSGIEVAPLENGAPQLSRAFVIPCDTVLLSVGLVPENELSSRAGVRINPVTNGPIVDSRLMTNIPGVFACGNALHIHDLADRVAEEASRAGCNCADWLSAGGSGADSPAQTTAAPSEIPVRAGMNVRYTVPSSIDPSESNRILLRSLVPMDRGIISLARGGIPVATRKLSWVRPGEMISLDFAPGELGGRFGGEFLEISLVREGSDVK